MTIRAHISDLRFPGEVRVWITRGSDERAEQVYRPGEFGGTWEVIPDEGLDVAATLQLPEEIARALADGLVRHFQGAEDTRRLRADYDAALRRGDEKDKLIADVLRSVTNAGGRP